MLPTPQLLVAAGAGLLFALGVAHAGLTVRSSPSGGPMTPCDPDLRAVLTRVGGLGFAPDIRSTLWRAWVGFNLSHALGVMGLSAVAFVMAIASTVVFDDLCVTVAVLAVPTVYLLLSLRYWFAKPTKAIAVGTGLIYAGIVVHWLG
ncbi:MAG: hypothetical protein K0V04_03685 [Deltaproteobacteria bacterium]|nr:hypothetical protein [Deltaproteobacteria bacterium]